MDTEERLALIKEVGEEIITEDDLKTLIDSGEELRAYDGFEPSGRAHLAQGIGRAINVNKMTQAGVKFIMLAADWHGWANNKLGGDLEKIQTAGDYLIEVWKASGMDTKRVEFMRSTDLLARETYWKTVMQIARTNTLKRLLRCAQIMGRSEEETLYGSQIMYPCMQAADIFELKINITQLGLDQRKVNMLAREVGPGLGFWKPVVVSHHMLAGLLKPGDAKGSAEDRALEMKMSKSKPDSAIFMEDSAEDVERKIGKAYCPEKVVEGNPILEFWKYIIFEKTDTFSAKRPEKFGGDLELQSYEELEKTYRAGDLHPMDLKTSTAGALNELLDPVRKHFSKGKAKELAETVRSFEVTR